MIFSKNSIESQAFDSCSGLTPITVQSIIPPTVDDSAFSSVCRAIPVYVPAPGHLHQPDGQEAVKVTVR